jgi:ligand-binding sensor domain-containing protein
LVPKALLSFAGDAAIAITTMPMPAQKKTARLLFLLMFLCCLPFFAQTQSRIGIGAWRLHVPYTEGRAVADAGDRVYLAAEQGLFYYDKEFRNVQPITRADGLSEQRISTIGYDPETKTLVVAYANANIDLLQGKRILNIPDIMRRTVGGDKAIHHILIHNKTAYLSTAFGVIVLDLAKQEIKDTYTQLGPEGADLSIKAAAIQGEHLYLATSLGVLRGNRMQSNLKDFRSWQRLSAGLPQNASLTAIVAFQDKVYLGTTAHGMLALQNGAWEPVPVPDGSAIRNMTSSGSGLTAATAQGILLLDQRGVASGITHPALQQPAMVVGDAAGILWVADRNKGLVALGLQSDAVVLAPDGPASSNSFQGAGW